MYYVSYDWFKYCMFVCLDSSYWLYISRNVMLKVMVISWNLGIFLLESLVSSVSVFYNRMEIVLIYVVVLIDVM